MDDTNSRVVADATSSFPSFFALRARHSELLQREPDTGDAKERCLKEVEHFISQVQATGVILSENEERRATQNILNYWVSALYRQDQVARLATLADYDPKLTAQIDDDSCPYPGAHPFTEENSQFFFGRQRQIDYMVGRLKEDRLLVIVGASGSGKTSLVQAGLLPTLKKEQPNDLKHFFFPPILPGSDPLMSLALMIQGARNSAEDEPDWLRRQIQGFKQDDGHLLKLIGEITDSPAVIFIDQGEELYEKCAPKLLRPLENILDLDNSKKTIEPLLDNLVRVVRSPDKKHIVIIARRIGEYEPNFNRLPSRVKEVFEPARVILPALYANELCDAIQKPAELLGVKFDQVVPEEPEVSESGFGMKPNETTVQALVKEISSEPLGLPLLQFTLPRLWEKRDGNKIPDSAFREMGSCRKALSNTAEKFYTSLSSSDQRACRHLFKKLVRLDGELKAHIYPVRRRTLYLETEKPLLLDNLIESLDHEQLVRVTKGALPAEDWIEITHDSLLSNWPAMTSWIESKRWARRRTRALKVVGRAAGLVLLTLAGFLVIGWQQQRTKSRDLAILSNKQARYDRFDLALQLGKEAYALEDNAATRGNLLTLLHSLQSTSHPKAFLHGNNFEAEDMVFSAENDPTRLAAIDDEGNIVIWKLNPPAIETTLVAKNAGHTASYPLAFSPDGKILATASDDPGTVLLWEIPSGGQKIPLVQVNKPFAITSLVFSTDSKTLITGNELGSVVEWDWANASSKDLYQHSARVNNLIFHPKRNMLASGSDDGTAIVWDFEAKKNHRRTFATGGEVKNQKSLADFKPIQSVAFSEKGELLAAGSDDKVFVWNLAGGKQLREVAMDPWSTGMLVSLNEDGTLLTCFSFKSGIFLYNVTDDEILPRPLYGPASTYSGALSNDGKSLAVPSEDGVSVWEVFSEHKLTAGGLINSISFSPNARIIASGGKDNTLTLWKTPRPNEYEKVEVPIQESSAIAALAFSEDGKLLAAGLQNGRISLRDPQNYQKIRVLDVGTGKLIDEKVSPATTEESASDAEEGETESQTPTHRYSVSKVLFDPQPLSRRLAAIVKVERADEPVENDEENLGSRIIIWDTNTQAVTDLANLGRVTSLAFSSYDSTLAWGGTNDKTASLGGNAKFRVFLKNTQSGEKPEELPLGDEARSLAFTKDGKTLAVGLANGEIVLWDITTRREIGKPLVESSGEVTNLVFSPNGKTLAAAMNKKLRHPRPGVVVLWDVDTGAKIANSLVGHDGRVSTIAFSCDGKILASASGNDSNIVLWDFDLAGSNDDFCKGGNCDRLLPEPAAELRKKSLFQKLYTRYLAWLNSSSKDISSCCNCAPGG